MRISDWSSDVCSSDLVLRNRYHLPAEVMLAQGDNELLLYLKHHAAAAILISHLRRLPAVLFEHVSCQQIGLVKGPQGTAYHSEIILPFKTSGLIAVPGKRPTGAPTIQRSFPPGSEWVYLKLYLGQGECDRLLMKEVNGFINRLKQEGLLQKWFFIRYADPEYNLRIRVLLRKRDGQLPFPSFSTCASTDRNS